MRLEYFSRLRNLIGRLAAELDIFFHTDAVQAAGKVAIDVQRIGCDLLSISGHKMHGSGQGVGAVYVREGNSTTSANAWWKPRTLATRWNRKCPRHCRDGQSSRTRESRL